MSKQVGTGVLFKNTYKKKDNQPDQRGVVTFTGTEYRIAGWNKSDKNGNPMISFSITEKEEKDTNTEEGVATENEQLDLFED